MPDRAATPATAGLRWSHIGLNCRDQQATEAFYSTLFGFRRARVIRLGDGEIVFLRRGDAYLELFSSIEEPVSKAGADGPANIGVVRHLAFQTDDLDSFLSILDDSVEDSLGPLRFDDFIPGWRSVWLRDPDGVIVEVSQGYRDE